MLKPDALRDAVIHEALSLLPILRRLPRRIDRIANATERGNLAVNVRLLADDRDVRIVNTLVNRALLAVTAAALGLVSVQLLDHAAGATLQPLQLVGAIGLLVSGVLTLRTLIESSDPIHERARMTAAHERARVEPRSDDHEQ